MELNPMIDPIKYACTNSMMADYDAIKNKEADFWTYFHMLGKMEDAPVEYIRRIQEIKGIMTEEEEQRETHTFYNLKKWLKTKQVYHFSTPLINALRQTTKDGFVASVLRQLPFDSFYIDLSNTGESYDFTRGSTSVPSKVLGCFVHVDHFYDSENPFLRYYAVYQAYFFENHGTFLLKNIFGYNQKTTSKENLDTGMETPLDYDRIPTMNLMELLMNMVVYIAASNADIEKKPSSTSYGSSLKGSKGKKPVTDWNVGYRIGPAIEKTLHATSNTSSNSSSAGGTGHATPRPHIRAAHWHHYWTGPKESRVLSLRWVAQTFVNCSEETDLPVVEHRSR